MNRMLTDELIVCTRNRPADVQRCLAAVAAAGCTPESVHVVDSSDGPETRYIVEALAVEGRPIKRLRYSHTQPGLPFQRNFGVSQSTADIVHFIDDDAVVETGYFESIMDFFASDQMGWVGGVCGQITNLNRRRPSRIAKIFLLDGAEGSVLPSGRNILVFGGSAPRRVGWLSGCSMSYRRATLARHMFHEGLAGYALGEDVELSTRVAQELQLWQLPNARIAHLESPIERWSAARRTRTELVHRYQRVCSGVAGQRRTAFWWSWLGQLLLHVGNVSRLRHPRHAARGLWATLLGGADVIRHRGDR